MEQTLEPTRRTDRILMLDATRGIAVLGILLMNITGFGLPNAYDNPTNWGGSTGLDLYTWRISALLFEGTMRGLFTLLFGAGVLLFLDRHTERNEGVPPTDLYYRRTVWLIVFGLINGYVLLWDGDILFYYGVVGLLLYLFRNMNVGSLFISAALALAIQTGITVGEWAGYQWAEEAAVEARQLRSAGMPLEEDQAAAIETFEDIQRDFQPTLEDQQTFIDAVRKSYASAMEVIVPRTWYVHTGFFLRHGLFESMSMMLLGMALYRCGFLTGQTSTRTYVAVAVAGYIIGLAVNSFEIAQLEAAGFTPRALMKSYLTYDLGRIPLTLAHIATIGLIFHAGLWQRAMSVMGSVGQMALTNYLSQSLLCLFLFTGAGLAWFGQLSRFELYYVVLGIWAVQIVWSRWWLSRFQFGPCEWLWRTLTYWRVQPLRRMQTD